MVSKDTTCTGGPCLQVKLQMDMLTYDFIGFTKDTQDLVSIVEYVQMWCLMEIMTKGKCKFHSSSNLPL